MLVANAPLSLSNGGLREEERMDGRTNEQWTQEGGMYEGYGGTFTQNGHHRHRQLFTIRALLSTLAPSSPSSSSPAFLAWFNLALPPPLALAPLPFFPAAPRLLVQKVRSFCVRALLLVFLSRFSIDRNGDFVGMAATFV